MQILPEDKTHQLITKSGKTDVTEVESYKRLLKDLVGFEVSKLGQDAVELEKHIPKFYTGDYNEDGFFLVLDDLSPEFSVSDFEAGLSVNRVRKALSALAHFHALGFSMLKLDPEMQSFQQRYPFLSTSIEALEHNPGMNEFLAANIAKMRSGLRGTDCENVVIPFIDSISDNVVSHNKRLILGDDRDKRQFLLHGDFWGNNILFNQDDDLKIVDWQFTLQAANPFFDIGLILFTSMDPEVVEQNMVTLLKNYFTRCESRWYWHPQNFLPHPTEGFLLQAVRYLQNAEHIGPPALDKRGRLCR